MAYENVTNALAGQKLPDMRTQIMQKWGTSPAWQNPDVDLAGDLARRFEGSGITDLSKLQFTPTQRQEMVSSEYMGTDEYRPAQYKTYDNAFELTYDGKPVGAHGFLGDINRDGSLGEGNVFASNTYHPNMLAWSSAGKGAHEYRVEFDAQGNPVINPHFTSSSFWNSDLGGLTKAAAMSVAAYGAAAGLGGTGAPATTGATTGTAAGTTAGMTASEQAAMMAANGMTDAQIAATLGAEGAKSAGLAGVGGGAATSTATTSPGLWDTVKQGASSLASSATQSGGANPGNPSWTSMAKDAIPLVGTAATLASGGSVATPQVPDYIRAAIATGNAGKYDEQTPYGTVSWSLRPGADPANPQPGDYIRSTNFSPEQQQLYEQNTQNQLTAGQVGGQQLADLGQGRQAVQDALYRRATQYYGQNFGDQENQLRTRLANQGLNEGTEAFERELRNFRQTRDSAYADATDRAIAGADQQENNAVARIVNILNMSKATTPTSGNSAGGAGTDLLSAANQAYTANLGASNAQAAADAQRQNAMLQLVLGGMKYYGG